MDNKEWIETLKVGDEVCITNKYNIARMLFGGFGSKETALTCKILKVRGILPDKSIVIEKHIFKSDGKLEDADVLSMDGELVEPTDELRELASRVGFIKSFSEIDWDKIKTNAMSKIVDIINESVLSKSKDESNETME